MHTGAVEIMTVEAEQQIAVSYRVTATARPQGMLLRLIDAAAESLIVTALLGELVLVLANVL